MRKDRKNVRIGLNVNGIRIYSHQSLTISEHKSSAYYFSSEQTRHAVSLPHWLLLNATAVLISPPFLSLSLYTSNSLQRCRMFPIAISNIASASVKKGLSRIVR